MGPAEREAGVRATAPLHQQLIYVKGVMCHLGQ